MELQNQVFLGEDLMQTRDYSDDTARVIDKEIERILREQQDRCRATLTRYRYGLDLVARALLEHETISGHEVERLIGVSRQGSQTGGGAGDKAGRGNGQGSRPGDTAGSPAGVPTPTA